VSATPEWIPSSGFQLEAEATLVPGAASVVVCHPHPAFGGRMDTPLVVALAETLAAAGLSTVRFNFRGLGRSGGQPTGGLAEHDDVRAAAAWLRERGAPRVALCGYSFGALMAMKAVAQGEPATALAAVGFPTTIIGDNADRLADVGRAIATGIPWLFLQGDRDVFCELARIRSWTGPNVDTQILDGAGHFFSGAAQDDVAGRVADFLGRALSRGA
jgi:alpha/beta superfamily hydrolase